MNEAATQSVIVERELPHTAEKVWRALTQAPLMADWLMNNDFEPVVGRGFTLRSDPMPQWNGEIACEVLVVEPPARLAYSWEALGLESVVTWTLTPTASGVMVRMEQSGFREDQEANYRGATYGWQKFFANLERILGELS